MSLSQLEPVPHSGECAYDTPSRLVRQNEGLGSALECFFQPRSLALVGATDREGSVGRAVLENLRTFQGRVFAVNAKRDDILGMPAFATLSALPEVPELVVIVTPAATVPSLVEEAGKLGVKAVVVISAGFKETGAEGARIEAEVIEAAKRHGTRLIGPNCLGLMNPHAGLNATFASSMARPGRVAFLSQSGALCTAILDWSHEQNVGFSAFVSLGSMADIGWMVLGFVLASRLPARAAVALALAFELFTLAMIRDNLTLFDREIADERVLAALAELGLRPWLDSMPGGLDTELGPSGAVHVPDRREGIEDTMAHATQPPRFTPLCIRDAGRVRRPAARRPPRRRGLPQGPRRRDVPRPGGGGDPQP